MSLLVMNKSLTAHGEVFLFHRGGKLLFINQLGFTGKRIMNRSKTSWSQSFLCICHCPQNLLVSHFIENKNASLRDTSINDISISLVSIIIWSNLKQICSLCSLKDLCIHTHSLTPSCHKGFISPPLHVFKTQIWKKARKKSDPSASHRSSDESASF